MCELSPVALMKMSGFNVQNLISMLHQGSGTKSSLFHVRVGPRCNLSDLVTVRSALTSAARKLDES